MRSASLLRLLTSLNRGFGALGRTLDRRAFWLRRLHSLTGVFPIGLYVIIHIGINSFAASGADVYDELAHFLESLPYLILIEIPFIWLPILYHSFYGIYVHAAGRANPFQYPYPNNLMYSLQRWSGVGSDSEWLSSPAIRPRMPALLVCAGVNNSTIPP